MKRTFAAAAILALTMGTALAATDMGKVAKIDNANDAITLDDGKTFVFAEGVEADTLKVGQTVEITYDSKQGKLVASKIIAR